VAVRIKLKRLGKIRTPMYRIVIADQKSARNSRSIEEVGVYQPKENPSVIQVNSERVQYWLSVGAQPTDPVKAILKLTGDWQKYTGEGDTSNKVQVAPPKVDRKAVYDAAVKDAFKVKEEEAKNPPKPKETPKVEEPKAEEVVAEVPAEEVKTEETTSQSVEETKAEEAQAPVAEETSVEENKEA